MTAFPSRILLATDLNARTDRAHDRAVQLAAEHGSTLVLVHVLEHGEYPHVPSWRNRREEGLEGLVRRDLAGHDIQVEIVFVEGRPGEEVLTVADERECGLIVTGIARNELLGRSALGATVERIVTRAHVPVLAVRSRAHGPYRRMVAAVDFSGSSRHTLEVAAGWFPKVEAAALHGYRVPYEGFTSREGSGDWFEDEAKHDRDDFLAGLDIDPGFKGRMKMLVEYGSIHELLGAYVHDKDVDLAVVGTHGRSGLFDIPLGGETLGLMTTAPCDVLAVPEPKAIAARRG